MIAACGSAAAAARDAGPRSILAPSLDVSVNSKRSDDIIFYHGSTRFSLRRTEPSTGLGACIESEYISSSKRLDIWQRGKVSLDHVQGLWLHCVATAMIRTWYYH